MVWTRSYFGRRAAGETTRSPLFGRLVSNKEYQEALDAFATLSRNDWQLVFVGDGPLKQRLEHNARELGVAANVQFLGARSDVAAILASAAIVVQAVAHKERI